MHGIKEELEQDQEEGKKFFTIKGKKTFDTDCFTYRDLHYEARKIVLFFAGYCFILFKS